jgi:hypothetical protein
MRLLRLRSRTEMLLATSKENQKSEHQKHKERSWAWRGM